MRRPARHPDGDIEEHTMAGETSGQAVQGGDGECGEPRPPIADARPCSDAVFGPAEAQR
jgi:hypothetical protein